MQRVLALPQSLTRSHDEYSSWLGLGSAISSLYKQRVARSGPKSLALITIYLIGSAVLKVTTAALFQLPTVPTIMMFPASSRPIIPPISPEISQGNHLLSVAMQLMSLASNRSDTGSDLIPSVGLSGNQIYDIIDLVPNATETRTVEVNISTVNVKCHTVDQSIFIGDTAFRGPDLRKLYDSFLRLDIYHVPQQCLFSQPMETLERRWDSCAMAAKDPRTILSSSMWQHF